MYRRTLPRGSRTSPYTTGCPPAMSTSACGWPLDWIMTRTSCCTTQGRSSFLSPQHSPVASASPCDAWRLRSTTVTTEAPASSPSTSPSPAAKEKGSLTPTTKAFVKEMTGHTEAMKNFGKISNYLANDRTLLAWTRTSLALARTTFAIAALAAASEGWLLALNFVTISLACLTVTFFMVGCIRFIDVRMALDSDQPPLFMLSRFSNSARSFWSPRRVIPVHILLGATVALISVAAAGKEFHK